MPPSNDNWSNAQFVGWGSLSTVSNVGATLEAGEPAQGSAGVTGTNSIWFAYMADIDGPVTFETGSSIPVSSGGPPLGSANTDTTVMDTALDVFTGSSLATLTLVATNDNDPANPCGNNPTTGGTTSRVDMDVTAGTTYYLRVTGKDNTQSGLVRIIILPGPGADNFASAAAISTASGHARASNIGATSESGEPDTGLGSNSIWWAWTAPATGIVEFDTFGSQELYPSWSDPPGTLDTVIYAYTGSALTGLTLIAANDDNGNSPDADPYTSKIAFHAVAGSTYRIKVVGFSDQGFVLLNWAAGTLPANDNFANAQTLTGTAGSLSSDTTGATVESGEPVIGFDSAGAAASVWYKVTPGIAGTLSLTLTATGPWDGALDVFTGSSLGSLTPVSGGSSGTGGIDNSCTVSVAVTGGTVYYVRVCSDDGMAPDYTGPFELEWTAPAHILTSSGTMTFGGTAYEGVRGSVITGTRWQANGNDWQGAATIDIGDTTDDGFTFDDLGDDYDDVTDVAGLERGAFEAAAEGQDAEHQAPALRRLLAGDPEPGARSIRQQWFDITSGPTLDDNGQPDPSSWVYERHSKTWGHYRIRVGTRNVTTFRGAHTLILQLSDTEPFGDDTCQLYFPAIGPFEPFGVGDLYWLPSTDTDRHIPIVIKHVHPDGSLAWHFEGQIQHLDETLGGPVAGVGNRTGLVLNGLGIVQCYDQRITKPRFTSDPIDIGRLIHRWTKYEVKYGFHGHPCPAKITGIKTAQRGGYGDPLMTTSIQNLLATAQTGEGTQWTITNKRPRGLHLVVKDLTTVDFSLWCGQPGVTHYLSRDLSQAYRAIFGEGQDHQVQWWRGTVYPNAYVNPPHFPLSAGSHFTPGGSDTGFTPFSDELKSRGYKLDSNDTYLASDENRIKNFQDDCGLTEVSNVGAQTWNAAFQDGENADVLQAFFRPLAVGFHAEKYLYNGRGGIIGRNPNYDHRTRREKLEQFGTMAKEDARESAKREIQVVYHADYAGTITLTNVDPPEMCALSIRSGMNFMFHGHHGFDRVMHVAKVDKVPGMDPQQNDRVVTLTTSEHGDDYVTLASRMQRNHDVKDQSGRIKAHRHSSRRTPDFAPWDSESGSGFLTPKAQGAGVWNVYAIPGGELGTIVHVRLVASTPTLIAAAVFNRRVTPRQLVRLPGLADPTSGLAGGQDPWTVNAKKLTRNLKFRDQPWMAWATGGPGAMQGYWPHTPSPTATVTGVLDDQTSWNYHSARPPWLWLAVWTQDACHISGDPTYDHQALFPGPPM